MPRHRPRSILSRFRADASGVGAVEFAMIAPFLFLLYLGGSELTIAITVDRKVEHTAATINDLVTQAQSLTADELKGIYGISKALILPYSTEGLKVGVTSVQIDDKGKATVDWSCPTTGLPKTAKGTPFTLPAEFSTLRERNIIVTETHYAYKPLSGAVFDGAFEMGATNYLEPRIGANVMSEGCAPFAL